MAGIFPGMDPYLEFQSTWPDFHNRLIAGISDELGARLPASYVARVDERIEVVTPGSDLPGSFRPDVLVGWCADSSSNPVTEAGKSATATLEPQLMEILRHDPEELRITWVEIRALPDLELVSVIEVLSPVNKSSEGRGAHLHKRDKRHFARKNLVEIDLLLGGAHLPMKPRINPGGYYAIVARGARLPQAEVRQARQPIACLAH
jgi:hypothetical protein